MIITYILLGMAGVLLLPAMFRMISVRVHGPCHGFHETSLLTAYSNDISYEDAYKEHLSIWARDGDLLIAISSSGRSKNILKAAAFAKERGCKVITFSGFSPDNPLRLMGDINFYVRSDEYGIVETAHAIILHCITDIVKHES